MAELKTVYLAALLGHKQKLLDLVPEFESVGYRVISSWVFGGEEGLCRKDIAVVDLEEVKIADAIVLFTEEYKSRQPGGGRFVEFGYAMGLGKELNIIGDRENVFMHHPDVNVYSSITEFKQSKETF